MLLPHDEEGAGPALVLLHAGIADRRMWAAQLEPLARAGLRVVALDLPGFGEAPIAVERDAPWSDVLETLDGLGIDRFALLGVSFGGAIAQRIAVVAPGRLWALALISSADEAMEKDPSPELSSGWEAEEAALELEDIDGAVAAVLDTWMLPGAASRLRLKVAQMQRRAYELQLQDGDPAPPGPDPLEADPQALGRIELPALVAYGEHDMSDFAGAAGRLAGAIAGARLEVIAGAGHLAPLEQPKAFRELLLGFLEECRPPT